MTNTNKIHIDNPGFGYLIGVVLGDGNLSHGKCKEYIFNRITLKTKDYDFAEKFANTIKNCCDGVIPKMGIIDAKWKIFPDKKLHLAKQQFSVTKGSKLLFLELKKYKDNPELCLDLPIEIQKQILKGLWDSEGSIFIYKKYALRLSFANSNNPLTEVFSKILVNCGFKLPTIYKYKGISKIVICRMKDIVKFRDEIGITIKRKETPEIIKRIELVKEKTLLYNKVIELRKNGLGGINISKELNIPANTINNWIYGISEPNYIK